MNHDSIDYDYGVVYVKCTNTRTRILWAACSLWQSGTIQYTSKNISSPLPEIKRLHWRSEDPVVHLIVNKRKQFLVPEEINQERCARLVHKHSVLYSQYHRALSMIRTTVIPTYCNPTLEKPLPYCHGLKLRIRIRTLVLVVHGTVYSTAYSTGCAYCRCTV